MKQAEEIIEQRESGIVSDPEVLFVDQSLRARMAQYGLSKREQEIAVLVIRGLSNREIATLLYICEQTVKDHLFSTFSKMTIHRRSQLAVKLLWPYQHLRNRNYSFRRNLRLRQFRLH